MMLSNNWLSIVCDFNFLYLTENQTIDFFDQYELPVYLLKSPLTPPKNPISVLIIHHPRYTYYIKTFKKAVNHRFAAFLNLQAY